MGMRCVIWLLAAAVAATGCGSPTRGCTEELRAAFVTALDSLNQPVPGATVSHVLPRTQTAITVPQDTAAVTQGRYTVLNDLVVAQLDTALFRYSGEAVRMSGFAGPTSFQADFQFDVPDGCHIHKLAGPDTVWFQ